MDLMMILSIILGMAPVLKNSGKVYSLCQKDAECTGCKNMRVCVIYVFTSNTSDSQK